MTGKDCKILDIPPIIEQISKHNMLCDFVDENIGPSDEYADVSLSNINDAGKEVIKNEAANKDLSNISSAGITVIQNNAAKKDLSNIDDIGKNNIIDMILPNLDKPTGLTFNSSLNWAAPVTGWIHFKGNTIKADLIKPDGTNATLEYWLSVNYTTTMNLIPKGYKIKYRSGPQAYSTVIFYPCNGAT